MIIMLLVDTPVKDKKIEYDLSNELQFIHKNLK